MLAFPPDFTFVIQLISFFLLLVVLHRLLFTPFMELLVEREQRTEGALTDAAKERRLAEDLGRKLEAEMAEARVAASAEAEAIRREARGEEAKLFESAAQQAASRLGQLRSGIEVAREQALVQLRQEAEGMAGQMVDAVLNSRVRR